MIKIPFVKIHYTGNEEKYLREVTTLSGDGEFTRRCHALLERLTHCHKALLTHSCTAALEMSALLLDIQPGDEIIMPSYTFVSTANAFVLRGGVPVFIDIRPDTLNLDEKLIESAITKKTRAIVPVHYAGISAEMDTLLAIAKKYNLYVIEDAAQGLLATYRGRHLGTIGHLGAYSFHETKNVISGEGGALLINDKQFSDLAEIIREKGTNRSHFFRGEVDKYTWQHLGSSYLPSELIAAFLLAQLEAAETITARRLDIWGKYHSAFVEIESEGYVRRPIVPPHCQHNGHMYYLLMASTEMRNQVLAHLRAQGIYAVFHYMPLHTSPGGERYGRVHQACTVTQDIAERIIRLPLYVDMTMHDIQFVIDEVKVAVLHGYQSRSILNDRVENSVKI